MPSLKTRIFYEKHVAEQTAREVDAALSNKANASTVGGPATALDAKADRQDVVAALEANGLKTDELSPGKRR